MQWTDNHHPSLSQLTEPDDLLAKGQRLLVCQEVADAALAHHDHLGDHHDQPAHLDHHNQFPHNDHLQYRHHHHFNQLAYNHHRHPDAEQLDI